MGRQRAGQLETVVTETQAGLGTTGSWPVNLLKANTLCAQASLRAVSRIAYPCCAFINLLKIAHIFLPHTGIVTVDCCDNKQYL